MSDCSKAKDSLQSLSLKVENSGRLTGFILDGQKLDGVMGYTITQEAVDYPVIHIKLYRPNIEFQGQARVIIDESEPESKTNKKDISWARRIINKMKRF